MPFDSDPFRSPQPEIPQQMRSHNLLAKGDKTFANSVTRRMHAKSTELKTLLNALQKFQDAQHNSWEAKEPLRDLERALQIWMDRHPNELEKRGRLVPELKRDIKDRMFQFGMTPTINNHVRLERKLGIENMEHGEPVNLWVKTRSVMWLANTALSTGASVGTNLSGGGTLAMVGLGTTLFTISAATGVGLVVAGAAMTVGSTAIQAKASISSRRHKKALEQILASNGESASMCVGLMGSRRDDEEHQMILDTVLPYIIAQKRKKMIRRGVGAIPVVGLGETFRSIGKKIKKLSSGTLGQEREEMAMVLAKHYITHDCLLCQQIIAELLSDEEEEWLRFQEFKIVAAILAEKMRSV
ncbi:MAG: hypothetical protein AAGJ28_08580 [Pseudomonadota bacterium]